MDYGNLLSRAWQITWKHKILWLFGILSALGSGGGGGGNFNFRGNASGTDTNPLPPEVQSQLNRPETVALILVVVCIALVIGLALFVIGVIARGGLVGGIRMADDQGAVTFREAWSVGTRYFWRLLGITLLLVLPVFLLAILTGFIAVATAGIGLICLLPILCIAFLALIPLGIVAYLAQFAVVLEDMSLMDSFRRGWEILKTNLGKIIVLGIIMIIISAFAGFFLALPLLAIIIPAALSFVGSRGQPNTALLTTAALAFVCYLPIAIVLSGILHTWTTSVWTLAYRQFTGNQPALPTTSIPPPPTPMQPT